MLLVVDVNIIFSSIIKEGKTAELLVLDKLELITPEFVLTEIEKHNDEILLKTHRSYEDVVRFLFVIEEKIEVIPSPEIVPFLLEAESIIPEHIKDIQYIALALKYGCALWSNEKRLKRQSRIEVFSTSDLARLFGR